MSENRQHTTPLDTAKKWMLFYFSGTGNAKQIALWFSEYGRENGTAVSLHTIASGIPLPHIDQKTSLMVISPIHGFNYPKITLDFIKKWPKGSNEVILMNTRAGLRIGNRVTPGLTGIAFFAARIILRYKGYRVKGQIPFDMPSNWFFLHPALNKRSVHFIKEKNHSKVRRHAKKIFSGDTDFLSRRDLIQDILISPVALCYSLAGKYVLAKSFYASAKCTHCKRCIEQCPVKAILDKNNRPFWTFRCQSCMKCMTICPEKAVESAHGLVGLSVVLSAIVFSVLSGLFFMQHLPSVFVKIVLFTFLLIISLFLLYRVQHIVLKNRYIEKLIVRMSLTHYLFWGKQNPKSDKRGKRDDATKM